MNRTPTNAKCESCKMASQAAFTWCRKHENYEEAGNPTPKK